MTTHRPRHEAPLPAPSTHDATRTTAVARIRDRAGYVGRHEVRS
jgi:hypothetical protein